MKRPIPWAVALTASLYWGLLFYWQRDVLFGDSATTDLAYDRAFYGIIFSVFYVAYVMACLMKDLPASLKGMPIIGKYGKFLGYFSMIAGIFAYCVYDGEAVGWLFVGVGIMGLVAALALTCLIYRGDEKSRLYALKRMVDVYPSITKPEGHVRFNQKLWTTTFVLIIYFAMTNVLIWGMSGSALDIFSGFRAIMAGASGSIMHLGIGPIVTGSIIMQLFAGAKIINLDLQDSDDKQMYQGVQKIVVLVMIPIESIPQTYGFLEADPIMISKIGEGWANFIIVAQLFAGSYLVFLLDELVSKWGIGSGISLFIAAGVAQSTFVGTLSPLPMVDGDYSFDNPPSGALPMVFYMLRSASNAELVSQNGFEVMLLTHVNPLVALASSVIVFLVVAYAESSKLELPLTHGKVRGHRGKYPIRLVYASNIPVILMAALLANINMFSLLFWAHPTFSTVPILGSDGAWSISEWIGTYEPGSSTPSDGFAWYTSMVGGVGDWLIPLLNRQEQDIYGHSLLQIMIHVVTYVVIMTLGSMVFAKFWIETTNMGAKDVAKQIERTGMQIPGFRKNPLVLEKILMRYIPPVTLFSGAFVGLLAAGADLLGTVGNATGTGLLLAVGIILRTYEQIQKEQAMEMHPMLRQFFGAE